MINPKVSIIILNWNGLKDTIECLESLKKISYTNYQVVVVDNGSIGNDADTLKNLYKEYITLIRKKRNHGFAGGNNIAINYLMHSSKPDYYLLLNNDTVVDKEFLTEMILAASYTTNIGVAGPKTYFFDKPRTFWMVWYTINHYKSANDPIGWGQIDKGQYDKIKYVDYVPGSCFLIKRSVIDKIGPLDEAYFAYWEESDYCIRARNAGFKIVYVPKAKIWHKVSVTLGKSPLIRYYMVKNRFRYMKKHATRTQYSCFLFYFFCFFFWWNCLLAIFYHKNIKYLSGFLQGTIDGLFIKLL